MAKPDLTESRRLNVLADVLREAVRPPSEAELRRGLHGLRERNAHAHARTWLNGRWALFAVAVLSSFALATVGASFLWSGSSLSEAPVALSDIKGGQILDGGYLSEVGNDGIKLFFNEGSKFELSPGTRGRLRVVASEGARLALERGSASFRITKSRDRRWAVEAGPFVIAVRGTDFAVVWDPTHEQLEVSLRRGQVAVSGPVVGDELVLHPGQSLTVSLPKRETIITQGRSGAVKLATDVAPTNSARMDPDGMESVATASEEAKSPSAPSAPGSAKAAQDSAPAWKEAVAKGQWDVILADVDRKGIAAMLGTLSSENLLALADAARYRRRPDLARAALLEQRRRFPGSPRSVDALFLLGRVEEQGAGKRVAIQRYDEYLAQAPAGTYAAEAMGRRMILTKNVEGAASASRVAKEYLRRFPNGSYAKAARALRQIR